jgi:hypothetical protein
LSDGRLPDGTYERTIGAVASEAAVVERYTSIAAEPVLGDEMLREVVELFRESSAGGGWRGDLSAQIADLFTEAQGEMDLRFIDGALRLTSRPEHARRAAGLCACGRFRHPGRLQCFACIAKCRAAYARRRVRLGFGTRANGGYARARVLSAERLKEIGRAAACRRWGYSGNALLIVSKEEILTRFELQPVKKARARGHYLAVDRVTGERLAQKGWPKKNVMRSCARRILQERA